MCVIMPLETAVNLGFSRGTDLPDPARLQSLRCLSQALHKMSHFSPLFCASPISAQKVGSTPSSYMDEITTQIL